MIEDRVNIDQFINSKKQILIEAFVKFYGEEKRKEITDRINNTIFLGYSMDKDYRSLLADAREECKSHAMDYFFSNINIPYNTKEEKEEAIKRFFTTSHDLKYNNLGRYFEDIDKQDNTYAHKNAIQAMKDILNKPDLVELDENGNYTQEFLDAQKYMNSLKELYDKTIEMYEMEVSTRFQSLVDAEKEAVDLRTNIKNELNDKYIKEIYQLLSEEDKKVVDNERYVNWGDLKSAKLFVSYSSLDFGYSSPIDVFTEESDKKLSDPKEGEWIKDSIKKERITYFKKMGIDLGDKSYEEYMEDPRVQEIYPNKEIVERIHKLKNDLKLELEVRMAKELPQSQMLRERAKDGTIMKDEEFAEILINGTTCITTNYSKVGDGLVERPTLFFPSTTETDSFDCRLIHECNHAYEMKLLSFDGDRIKTIVGWDVCNYKLSVEAEASMEERNKRSFEMLNEIINELIAQDICTIMHSNGTYIMGDEKTSDNTSHSGYQMSAFLVRNFYNQFKDVIIESRRGGNLQVLFDTVGEDNFMELNQLLYDFSDRFKGFEIYKALQEIKENKDTERSRYYIECKNKGEEIFSKMMEYSNSIKK